MSDYEKRNIITLWTYHDLFTQFIGVGTKPNANRVIEDNLRIVSGMQARINNTVQEIAGTVTIHSVSYDTSTIPSDVELELIRMSATIVYSGDLDVTSFGLSRTGFHSSTVFEI